jgi:Zn-dependent peptidase ImmA (M78 family)
MASSGPEMSAVAKALSSESARKLVTRASGLSRQRLEQLAGGAEPTLRELRLVAKSLRLALTDLVPSTKAKNAATVLFRTANQSDAAKSFAFINLISLRIGYSLDLLGPSPKLLWRNELAIAEHDADSAEQAAITFRRLFLDDDQFTPLLNLPHIIVEKMHILLFVIKAKEFDGVSAIVEGQPFIFLSQRFNARMLFTLAHEVGHIIATPSDHHEFAVLDKSGSRRPGKQSTHELFAHRFASALLLPRAGVVSALARIRELSTSSSEQIGDIEILLVARFFGVSFAVAGNRFEQLGLLPRGATAQIESELRRVHHGPEQRAREAGLPERNEARFPIVAEPLLRAAIEKIRAGEVSLGRAAAVLGLSSTDLVLANA